MINLIIFIKRGGNIYSYILLQLNYYYIFFENLNDIGYVFYNFVYVLSQNNSHFISYLLFGTTMILDFQIAIPL